VSAIEEPMPSTGDVAVRPAAAAGRYYPADPGELLAEVRAALAAASAPLADAKAFVLPHATHERCGRVAAAGYRSLALRRDTVRRVVLLGPSHYDVFPGLAATGAAAFRTPLGDVPVDQATVRTLLHFTQVHLRDRAHRREHSLEVHLPFLQVVLRDFEIVPLLTGDASPAEVAEVLAFLWGGPETAVVVSSDLSHYQDAPRARLLDAATTRAIEALEGDRVGATEACGFVAIRGLLHLAGHAGLSIRTLDRADSCETGGPATRVVGFGAYAVA
jgi:AmmeMemoRadiSam system protein B